MKIERPAVDNISLYMHLREHHIKIQVSLQNPLLTFKHEITLPFAALGVHSRKWLCSDSMFPPVTTVQFYQKIHFIQTLPIKEGGLRLYASDPRLAWRSRKINFSWLLLARLKMIQITTVSWVGSCESFWVNFEPGAYFSTSRGGRSCSINGSQFFSLSISFQWAKQKQNSPGPLTLSRKPQSQRSTTSKVIAFLKTFQVGGFKMVATL